MFISRQKQVHVRRGSATVEMALVLNFVMFPLMVGLWEMGRVVQVQQIVANSTREGARMAAQAVTINTDGSLVEIKVSGGTGEPSVRKAVHQYLAGAGLNNLQDADITVTFTFLDGDTSKTQPYQGEKNQRFRVTVTVNYADVQWTILGIVRPTTITYSVDWRMLVDEPFLLNPQVPSW